MQMQKGGEIGHEGENYVSAIDGNDLVKLVIKYELYITPVKTYVLEEFYSSEE